MALSRRSKSRSNPTMRRSRARFWCPHSSKRRRFSSRSSSSASNDKEEEDNDGNIVVVGWLVDQGVSYRSRSSSLLSLKGRATAWVDDEFVPDEERGRNEGEKRRIATRNYRYHKT